MAFRRAPARISRPKRSTVWGGIFLGPAAVPADTSILLGVLSATALALRPFTIVRSRLLISWATDQVAATEWPHGAVGMVGVSQQASAAGMASVPSPTDESDAPFIWYQPVITDFLLGDATGFGMADNQYVVDSKSMRKIETNEDLVTTVTNLDSADGATITIVGRLLFKLH